MRYIIKNHTGKDQIYSTLEQAKQHLQPYDTLEIDSTSETITLAELIACIILFFAFLALCYVVGG